MVVLALALVALAGPAAVPGGTAEGTITVNGQTTKLSHAYARAVPGFFDKSKEDVEVVLSDVPLEPAALEDVFERIHMADAGKLHAFEITINAEGKPISTSFRHNGFKNASPSGLSTSDVFTAKTFDGRTVDARYVSAGAKTFFDNTYAFDVAFRADVTRKAKAVLPSAEETAAAQSTIQAKVYGDFVRAVQKEDLPALRKLFTKEQAQNLDDPDAKKMLKVVRMMAPTNINVLKVVEKGDAAELTVTGRQDDAVVNGVVHMTREGGLWKVQREEWKSN